MNTAGNCVQLSTSVTTVVTKSHIQLPTYREKCNLPTIQGLNRPFPCLYSSSSSRGSRNLSVSCNAIEGQNAVLPLIENDFEEDVLKNTKPVIVEFWAEWCGPCKMLAPVVEELAREYSDKIGCYMINTDECPNIATQYNIRSIPTLLVFKDGEKKESIIGAMPKTKLKETIDKYLA